MMTSLIQQLIHEIFGLKDKDKFVYIYDDHFAGITPLIRDQCSEASISFKSLKTEYEIGQEVPDEIASILLGPTHNVVLFGLKNTIWHTKERKKAKYSLGKRLGHFVCSPSWLAESKSMQLEREAKKLGERIKGILYKTKKTRITNKAGTNLEAKLSTRSRTNTKYCPFLEIWPYNSPGTGGDLPSGEVGFGPEVGSVNGKIVFDLKMQYVGLLEETLEIVVNEDEIIESRGHPVIKQRYGDILARHQNQGFISEVSIGLTPNIPDDKDIRFIPEEKRLGTMHFGHGGNLSYGDREGPHLDGVIRQATFEVDGHVIIKNGRFARSILEEDVAKWLEKYDAVFYD